MKKGSLLLVGLALTSLTTFADEQTSSKPMKAIEKRGKYLVQIAGCNDCHTQNYAMQQGNVDESEWLKGNSQGFDGPWGTSYAANLRLVADAVTVDEFASLARAQSEQLLPPMPWFNLRAMHDRDIKAIYAYLKYLGPAGEPVPSNLPPQSH